VSGPPVEWLGPLLVILIPFIAIQKITEFVIGRFLPDYAHYKTVIGCAIAVVIILPLTYHDTILGIYLASHTIGVPILAGGFMKKGREHVYALFILLYLPYAAVFVCAYSLFLLPKLVMESIDRILGIAGRRNPDTVQRIHEIAKRKGLALAPMEDYYLDGHINGIETVIEDKKDRIVFSFVDLDQGQVDALYGKLEAWRYGAVEKDAKEGFVSIYAPKNRISEALEAMLRASSE
jgi:hypothetical protein